MTKSEFFHLVEKFEKGQCKPSEKTLLMRFCEEVQIKASAKDWELSAKEETKIRVLKRILQTITNDNKVSEVKSIPRRFKIWRIAVVFVLLIGSTVLLQKILAPKSPMLDLENKITLKLPDGSIQVVEEGGNSIVSTSGNVIGSIKNRSLIYNLSAKDGPIEYHTLKVPYGKKFQVQLSDGSLVYMNAGSSLNYPSRFLSKETRKVSLKGEAFFEVTKDSLRPFVVNADQLDISVLGTKFNVNSYEEDMLAKVVLTEGLVSLSSMSDEKETFLRPGEMGVLNKKNSAISKNKVITTLYTSWMSGELVFRDIPFKNMMKKLERHYNLVIINKNKALANEKFNASFDAITANEVFESLKQYHGIQFKRSNDTIVIQ